MALPGLDSSIFPLYHPWCVAFGRKFSLWSMMAAGASVFMSKFLGT